jgi:hypothetical protein
MPSIAAAPMVIVGLALVICRALDHLRDQV